MKNKEDLMKKFFIGCKGNKKNISLINLKLKLLMRPSSVFVFVGSPDRDF